MFRPKIRYHDVMVDDVLWLVLVVLATTRVTRYVTMDKLNEPMRTWAVKGPKVDPDGSVSIFGWLSQKKIIGVPFRGNYGEDSKRAYLLFCQWCTGIWAALAIVSLGYWGYGQWWAQWPITILAVAQVAPALLALPELKPQITINNGVKETEPWR